MSLVQFVLRYLPPSPARVLEIGCGPVGDLSYAIAAAGYAIVAVDPVAPEGPLFRRIPLSAETVRSLVQALAVEPTRFVGGRATGLSLLTVAEAATRLEVPATRAGLAV
ncbi:MAG: hypothetical protein K0S14_448 [Thermomicrobiales bacterium]|jgi:hypothetical protein|nr:hypothetical protein [Thermomicrobiales bacterium]MCD6057267.1 hypothetical protein [Thermomicrobiales bacterium]